MTGDPIQHFERLADIARTAAAPRTEVADAVCRRIARERVMLVDDVDRSRLWFAGVTTVAALVVALLLWPSDEITLNSYALLWSPWGETLQ